MAMKISKRYMDRMKPEDLITVQEKDGKQEILFQLQVEVYV